MANLGKFPKIILYQIGIHVKFEELWNFFCMCRRLGEISRDDYFWRWKRSVDYPDCVYPETWSLTEREKYQRLKQSGNVVVWGTSVRKVLKLDFDVGPLEIKLDGKSMMAYQVIPFNSIFEGGMYVLTFSGEVYVLGTDSASHMYAKIHRSEPKLLLNMVLEIYAGDVHRLFIKTQQGHIMEYVNGKLEPRFVLETVKKFVRKNLTSFILTDSQILYINDKIFDSITDFEVFGDMLYYVKNDEIWAHKYLGPSLSGMSKFLLRVPNLKTFAPAIYTLFYITKTNDLYGLIVETQEWRLLNSNVIKITTDRHRTLNYIKDDGTVYTQSIGLLAIPSKVDFISRPISLCSDWCLNTAITAGNFGSKI